MTRRDPIAEDIAQETLLRAFLHWDELDPRRSPWPWLKKVATRLVYDEARVHRRGYVDAVDDSAGGTDAVEDRHLVDQMLDALPERQRAAVELRYLEDWKSAEIAAVLQVPRPAVEQLLLRARRSLRTEYRRLSGDRLRLALWPLLAWIARLRDRTARTLTAVGDACGGTAVTAADSFSALVVAGALTAAATGVLAPAPPTASGAEHHDDLLRMSAPAPAVADTQPSRPRVRSHVVAARPSGTTRAARSAEAVPQEASEASNPAVELDAGIADSTVTPRATASSGRKDDKVTTKSEIRVSIDGQEANGTDDVVILCDSGSMTAALLCAAHDEASKIASGAP